MDNLPVRNYVGLVRAASALVACNMTGTQEMSVARGRLNNLVLPEKFNAKNINIDLMGLNHAQLIEVVDGGDDVQPGLCSPETVEALDFMFDQMMPYAP